MGLDLSLGKLSEIDQQNMPVFGAWSSHYKVGVVVGKRNQVVYFTFFEPECFNYVLYFHAEEVYEEDLVIECNDYLVLPDSHLLYFRIES
jgi:hypothetical protein